MLVWVLRRNFITNKLKKMKKVLVLLAIVGFVACKNEETPATPVDSPKVETPAAPVTDSATHTTDSTATKK